MDFETQLKAFRKISESGIARFTPSPDTPPVPLHRAMRYSLEAGGKRLRPVLLLAGHALMPSRVDPVPAAVAVECIHTYSLIHDDLPAMDDSDLRRGNPSCHVQFDEATAILAGDALLTHAFFLLADAYAHMPDTAIALIRDLGRAAGNEKLIGGQMADILGENSTCNAEQLDFIHRNKTAALITAACTIGMRLNTHEATPLESMEKVGRNVGLAFQIIDDILDATSDQETLGKTTGQDAVRDKNTYVRLHGLERSRDRARELTAKAVAACRALPGDTNFLVSLMEYMERRIR